MDSRNKTNQEIAKAVHAFKQALGDLSNPIETLTKRLLDAEELCNLIVDVPLVGFSPFEAIPDASISEASGETGPERASSRGVLPQIPPSRSSRGTHADGVFSRGVSSHNTPLSSSHESGAENEPSRSNLPRISQSETVLRPIERGLTSQHSTETTPPVSDWERGSPTVPAHPENTNPAFLKNPQTDTRATSGAGLSNEADSDIHQSDAGEGNAQAQARISTPLLKALTEDASQAPAVLLNQTEKTKSPDVPQSHSQNAAIPSAASPRQIARPTQMARLLNSLTQSEQRESETTLLPPGTDPKSGSQFSPSTPGRVRSSLPGGQMAEHASARTERSQDIQSLQHFAGSGSTLVLIGTLSDELLSAPSPLVNQGIGVDRSESSATGIVESEQSRHSRYGSAFLRRNVHANGKVHDWHEPQDVFTMPAREGFRTMLEYGDDIDSEALASLINDVLVEQARLHGVDLS